MRLLLFIVLLSASLNSYSCECKRITFKSETDNSDLIFRGIVTKKVDSLTRGKFVYSFSISQVWKGEAEHAIALSSWNSPMRCGADLDLGKEYIIYSKNGQISHCGRSELYSVGISLPLLNYKFSKNDDHHYGTGNAEVLNSFESTYFNAFFDNSKFAPNKIQTDFTKAKVAYFINGTLISKKAFFEMNRKEEQNFYFYKFKKRKIEMNGGYLGVIYLDKTSKISRLGISRKLKGVTSSVSSGLLN